MSTHKVVRILICTGHTGGHFFPALSFAETFLALHPEAEIHFFVNRIAPFAETLVQDSSFQFHLIPLVSPPNFFSFKIFSFLIKWVKGFGRAFSLFQGIRPSLVVGFGSFGSVPGLVLGIFFRTPILLHEQNASFGRANRFFARFAARIALSFPKTIGEYSGKTFWGGYPLRKSFLDAVEADKMSKELDKPFTFLVFGGSQGAARINEIFVTSLSLLRAEERKEFAVIHIVGTQEVGDFENRYQQLGIRAQVYEFSRRISEHYRDTDLVISRAGAGTIFELAAIGRAAILIPYPYAYAHQKMNAEYLLKHEAAYSIDECSLTSEGLLEVLLQLKTDKNKRIKLEENMRHLFKPNAARDLSEVAWDLICKKN